MALNFPNNPANGQTWTDPTNGITYMFDGVKWLSFGGVNLEQYQLLLDRLDELEDVVIPALITRLDTLEAEVFP